MALGRCRVAFYTEPKGQGVNSQAKGPKTGQNSEKTAFDACGT